MKNSQVAIIIAIAVLIGYTLVKLGNSATYSDFTTAASAEGETTTVIAFLDLDAEMAFEPKLVQFSFGAIDKTRKEAARYLQRAQTSRF